MKKNGVLGYTKKPPPRQKKQKEQFFSKLLLPRTKKMQSRAGMHWDRADWYGKEKRRNAAKEESHVRKALRFGSNDEARMDAIYSALYMAEGDVNKLENGAAPPGIGSGDVLERLYATHPREIKGALSSLRYMADECPLEVVQFLGAYVNGASEASTGAAAFLAKKFPATKATKGFPKGTPGIFDETVVNLDTLARASVSSRADTRSYFSSFWRM